MPNPTIRFEKSSDKPILVPAGFLLFEQSLDSDDIGSYSFQFDFLENVDLDFDFEDEFGELLRGERTTLVLPDYYDDVEIVLNLDQMKIYFKATSTSEPVNVAFAEIRDIHNDCGIDDSQDPDCRFRYGRGVSCQKPVYIDSTLDNIKGKIEVDLYVSGKNKKKKNTFKVAVTTYVNDNATPAENFKLSIIKDDAHWVSTGRADDMFEFKDSIEFKHNGKKDICYLVEVMWHDVNGSVSVNRTGKGYVQNQKITIGDVSHLPVEIRRLKRPHIAWK